MTNPNPNNRNLPAVQSNTALTTSAAQVAANIAASREVIEAVSAIDPDLAARMLAIIAGQSDKKPLSVPRAIQAAAWEQKTGKIMGQTAYVDDRLGVMEAVRGLREDVSKQAGAFETRFRQLTADEHGAIFPPLAAGDMAIACEVMVYDHYHKALQVMEAEKRVFGVVKTLWTPPTGIGIIREAERYDSKAWNDGSKRMETLPREQYLKRPLDLGPNFSWDKKLRIRAEREALKRVPGVKIDAAELFDAADAAGLGDEIERLGLSAEQRARLSREAAEVVIERAEHEAGRGEVDPAEQAARFRANVEAMRGSEGFEGFGDEPDDRTPIMHGEVLAAELPSTPTAAPSAPPPPHWSQVDGMDERFYAYAKRLGLDQPQALTALGVTELTAYAGTALEAKAAVNQAVEAAVAAMRR